MNGSRASTASRATAFLSLTAALVVALAACGGGSGASPGGTLSAATIGPSTAAAGATSIPAASKAGAVVDLTFSGTKAFVAKGSAGRCILTSNPDGTIRFGFEATEADYPGLGESFSLANLNGDNVDVKWSLDGSTAYGLPMEGRVVLSADHRSVTLDNDLQGLAGSGTAIPGPEHVKGSVTCP